tara:strand:- start:693 stop:812 length:120 start_codon:yes stop_codon:yes gene_type:complete
MERKEDDVSRRMEIYEFYCQAGRGEYEKAEAMMEERWQQ